LKRSFSARSGLLARRRFLEAASAVTVSGVFPSGLISGRASAFAAVPGGAADAGHPAAQATADGLDEITRATVAELETGMAAGTLTAVTITERFLDRIQRLDRRGPAIHAMIELNPDALDRAAACDAERRAGHPLGPLHGIPVLLKDNIDTADRMKTSAGSLALAGSTPPRDAFIVDRLRAAGAVILGKTNLSEWANFRSTRATSGWSARGGLTRNPHVLDRNTSGSSSGTAAGLAAAFAPLGIGTETDGSIISPSAICGIVGIKPTVGLWSRSGIIPISASQDTPGPMARTVTDAARLLGPLSAPVDRNDRATLAARRTVVTDYTQGLDRGGLRGARLGAPRALAGFHPDVDRTFDLALAALTNAGATIVQPIELGPSARLDEAELEVLLYELKAGLAAYLGALGPSAPVKSLADVIAFNERERPREMPWFGQELFERAQRKGGLGEPAYRAARRRCLDLARTRGLDLAFSQHAIDALIWPSNAPAWLTDLMNGDHVTGGNTTFAAVAGYPSVTVPMGQAHGLPLGLSFVGPAFSEHRLVKMAYAFEQETLARQAPRFLPTLDEARRQE
jgi:amidase